MAVKIVDSTLKKEDVKEGYFLRLQQNHFHIYYKVVSPDEFKENIDSKLYDIDTTREMVRQGKIICVKVNGRYTTISLDIFNKESIVENLEEELKKAHEVYQREKERMEDLANKNVSLLEEAIKEQSPLFKLA